MSTIDTETYSDTGVDDWWMYPENIDITADFLIDEMQSPGATVGEFWKAPWKFTAVYECASLKKLDEGLRFTRGHWVPVE